MDYKASGVDVEKAKAYLEKLKPIIGRTNSSVARGSVVSGVGGFAGIFRTHPQFKELDLVASTDGVGTKLELCRQFSYLEGIGYDLVAMCVNDLYCSGGIPAFFLDYYSCGKLNASSYSIVLESIADACRDIGIALLGGETAEHPGVMPDDHFDLAGFCVGFVSHQGRLPKTDTLRKKDVIAALPATGLHSNGFSLVRMIMNSLKAKDPAEYNVLVKNKKWIREQLLSPTRIYSELPDIINTVEVKALAHITGGGIYENLPRVFPEEFVAMIEEKPFSLPIYDWLRKFINKKELYQTFNMGFGMILILDPHNYRLIKEKFKEIKQIGYLERKTGGFLKTSQRVFIQDIDTF